MIENDFLELLVDLLLFAKDDIAFSLDGLILKFRILQDIGEYVDAGGYI